MGALPVPAADLVLHSKGLGAQVCCERLRIRIRLHSMKPKRTAMEVGPRQSRHSGNEGHACLIDARKSSYDAMQGWECSCAPGRPLYSGEGSSHARGCGAGHNVNDISSLANNVEYRHNSSSPMALWGSNALSEGEWRQIMRFSSLRSMASVGVEYGAGDASFPDNKHSRPGEMPLHLSWSECAANSCSVELICTDLFHWAAYNNNPRHLPPSNYEPSKSRNWSWHCEIEIRNCDNAVLRVGVIGPGIDSVPGPILDRNGAVVVPGSVVQQRVPTLKDRDANGQLVHPWERSLGLWEFECGRGCLYWGPCDIDIALPKYPYSFDPWGAEKNCNTFASWYLHYMGIEFDDWPEQIKGICPEVSPWRPSR